MSPRVLALLVLLATSCSKKSAEVATQPKEPEAKTEPAGKANFVAKFEDAKLKKEVTFEYARVVSFGKGLALQLADRPVSCRELLPDTFRLTVEIPPPPAFAAPMTYPTMVQSFGPKTEPRLIARGGEATLTLTAFSKDAGGRVAGEITFASKSVEGTYSGKGWFDAHVCPDEEGRKPTLRDVVTVPRDRLDRPAIEGTAFGKPFAVKTAIAITNYNDTLLRELKLCPTVVTCDTYDSDKGCVGLKQLAIGANANNDGTLQPATVSLRGNSSISFVVSPMAWIRIDRIAFPAKGRVHGSVAIASAPDEAAEDTVELGGAFDAIVCH